MYGKEIVLTIFILAALVVVLLTLFFRFRRQQLLHKERMTALEKGIAIPEQYTPEPWSTRVYLLRGMMWSFAGLAFCISFWGITLTTQKPQSAESALWRAHNLVQYAGISMEEAKQIIGKDRNANQEGIPKEMALLGLIPIGVGLAYLIFYYTGDKEHVSIQPSSLKS